MSDSTTEFPPPTPGVNPVTWAEMVNSQIKAVQALNYSMAIIAELSARIQAVEDLLYKFLGIDDQGRIPGMPGYDGPLKDAIAEYQQLRNQAKPVTTEPPVTPGAYL